MKTTIPPDPPPIPKSVFALSKCSNRKCKVFKPGMILDLETGLCPTCYGATPATKEFKDSLVKAFQMPDGISELDKEEAIKNLRDQAASLKAQEEDPF